MDGSTEELHEDEHPLFGSDLHEPHTAGARARSHRRERARRRRRRRLAPILAILVIAVVLGASYLIVKSVTREFATPDYSGVGQGFTRIAVAPGDAASDIAATLVKAGVVKSERAFVNAAQDSGQAGQIQPGVYRVRKQASGKATMAAILDPANRLVSQVTIPEGFTSKQVMTALSSATGVPVAELDTAAANIGNLGLPPAYKPKSAEGFLFPATYQFNPDQNADDIVQALTTQYGVEDVKIGFTAAARAEGITPYDALIIASIAEAEAKFDADRAKVARVILNRLAAKRALQVDATSAYAAKMAGLDPAKVIYDKIDSPYNSYTHAGLPPTPIGNPGLSSMEGAVHAPAGTWLYYVNIDAAGHLGFFTDEKAFTAAADTCKAKGWGCG